MTDDEIKSLKSDSLKMIENKQQISQIDSSLEDYKKQIRSKFEDDTPSRLAFIRAASIISGLTLEYRNIYGIEAPYYDVSDCKIGVDINGDGSINDADWVEINDDGDIYFKDDYESVNAAMFDAENRVIGINDADSSVNSLKPADNQNYFIDEKKADESSSFFNPLCPIGLDKWRGKYLWYITSGDNQKNTVTKAYPLTELQIYNMMISPASHTIGRTFTIKNNFSFINWRSWWGENSDSAGYFNSGSPVQYNVNKEGKITKTKYSYSVSEEELYAMKNNDIRTFSPSNVTDNAPIIYYRYTIPVNQTQTVVDDTGDETEYLYSYSYAWEDEFINNESLIVKYKLIDTNNYNFCEGYAVLTRDPSQVIPSLPQSQNYPKSQEDLDTLAYENSRLLSFNILTQSGPLSLQSENKSETVNHRFLWWRWTTVRSWTDYHNYTVTVEPVSDTSAVTLAFAKFYKNMVDQVTWFYDYYVSQGLTINFDIATSNANMKAISAAAANYINNQSNSNKTALTSAILSRLNYVYNNNLSSNPPSRANAIHNFLRKTPALFNDAQIIAESRLNKRNGSLREMYVIVKNTNIAASSAQLRKKNIASMFKYMLAYNISSGFGSNKISVSIEPWETPASIFGGIFRMSPVYLVCDIPGSIGVIKARVMDINQVTSQDGGSDSRIFEITLKIDSNGGILPKNFENYNPRLVKTFGDSKT